MWQGEGNVALLSPPRCSEEAYGSLKSLMGVNLLSFPQKRQQTKTKPRARRSNHNLLGDILLPSIYQTNEFPRISIVDKYNSVGATPSLKYLLLKFRGLQQKFAALLLRR
jgi:hypothetical protein